MVECPLMVRWVVRSIRHGGPIELFLVPTSAPSVFKYIQLMQTKCTNNSLILANIFVWHIRRSLVHLCTSFYFFHAYVILLYVIDVYGN